MTASVDRRRELAWAVSRRAGVWFALGLLLTGAQSWAADGAGVIDSRWPGLREPTRRMDEPNEALKELLDAHRSEGFSATFKESKHLALLERPLESSGVLVYRPNRGLYRRMDEPFRQELIITPKRMESRDEKGRVERLTGAGNAFAVSMRDAMLGLFAGSWKDMSRVFVVSHMQREEGWVAALEPRDRELSRMVQALVLEGKGKRLTDLWVIERNGNWTHDTFLERAAVEAPDF